MPRGNDWLPDHRQLHRPRPAPANVLAIGATNRTSDLDLRRHESVGAGETPPLDSSARRPVKSPILRRSETNRTSGITAKGSCIDRMTWLNTSNCPVPRSP